MFAPISSISSRYVGCTINSFCIELLKCKNKLKKTRVCFLDILLFISFLDKQTKYLSDQDSLQISSI